MAEEWEEPAQPEGQQEAPGGAGGEPEAAQARDADAGSSPGGGGSGSENGGGRWTDLSRMGPLALRQVIGLGRWAGCCRRLGKEINTCQTVLMRLPARKQRGNGGIWTRASHKSHPRTCHKRFWQALMQRRHCRRAPHPLSIGMEP